MTASSLNDSGSAEGSKLYLLFVCIVSAMGGLLFGFDTVVISGTVSTVKDQFGLSNLMEGVFVASALLGCVIGSALAGTLSDQFGRKKVLFLSSLLFLATAFGCSTAGSTFALITFRLIGGMGIGVASMVSPLYISEISPSNVRGRMVTLFQFAITIGICLSLLSNAFLQHLSDSAAGIAQGSGLYNWMVVKEVWRSMFAISVIPALAFTALSLTIPESPRWLAKMGRDAQATAILVRVSGAVAANEAMQNIKDAISHETGSLVELVRPGLRKALFVAIFLAVVSEFSGITVVLYYGPGILTKAGVNLGSALSGFVIIGIVNMVFTLIAIGLMDRLGRKPLLFWGSLGCFIALSSIGYLFSTGHTDGVVLVALICLFVACFAFSMGPIKWVVMSEIFPTRIRGRAVAIATLAVWLADTVYNQLFPVVRDSIGVAGCFFIFAAVLVPQFFFILKVMPETKGRSLEEIEKSWTVSK